MTLKELLNTADKFAESNGIRITKINEGHAWAEMRVEEKHLNGAGVCQGGAIFTLGDMAIAGAVNSHRKLCLGTNANIHYCHSAQLGDVLTAECQELSARKLPLVEVRISNQDGTLIALMTGECYKKNEEYTFDSLDEERND